MKVKKMKASMLIMLITSMMVVTACTNSDDNPKVAETSKPVVTDKPVSTDKPVETPADAKPVTAKENYEPAIKMTTVRSIGEAVEFRPGESYTDNVWTKDFAKIYGINVEYKWTVNSKLYNDKITVSMIAGDLPDFYEVDAKQLQQIVDAGQAADLTDIYAEYASDVTKRSFEEFGGIKMEGASFNGKLMAIPLDGGLPGGEQMIWIRNDWLKNLSLDPPKTMDDVMKIAIAFTKDDPDKNKKNDTFGLNMMKDVFGGWAGIDGFINGYHAYAFNPANTSGTALTFLKGADGKPVLADTLPEVKTALGKLQELFKAGAINKEFSAMDSGKAGDLATSGKVGMSFGEFWVGTWPINNMKKADPKVDWQPYPIVSADDKPVHALGHGGYPTKFMVVNKNSKNPEAVMKMLNYFHEKVSGPNADESYHNDKVGDKNFAVFSLAPIIGPGFSDRNMLDNDAIQEALKTGDESKLATSAMVYYKGIKEYNKGAGNLDMWFWNALFGPGGAYSITNNYDRNTPPVMSGYIGQPTMTMISNGPNLRDLEIKIFTEIINNTRPLDDFDTAFVAEWHKQGGDDILKEVADSGRFK